jgi:hypothetical protein
MRRDWGLLAKLLDGTKTIESRWYKSKRSPWGLIRAGDTVYFKESGKPVTARARVKSVLQLDALSPARVAEIIANYGDAIGIPRTERAAFCSRFEDKRYCILVFLEQALPVPPFDIDKSKYGPMAAWVAVDQIDEIRLQRAH